MAILKALYPHIRAGRQVYKGDYVEVADAEVEMALAHDYTVGRALYKIADDLAGAPVVVPEILPAPVVAAPEVTEAPAEVVEEAAPAGAEEAPVEKPKKGKKQ